MIACLTSGTWALQFVGAHRACDQVKHLDSRTASRNSVVPRVPMATQHCNLLTNSPADRLRAPSCRQLAQTPPALHRHRSGSAGTVQCTLTSPRRVSSQEQQVEAQHLPQAANGSRSWRPTSKGVGVAESHSALPQETLGGRPLTTFLSLCRALGE